MTLVDSVQFLFPFDLLDQMSKDKEMSLNTELITAKPREMQHVFWSSARLGIVFLFI